MASLSHAKTSVRARESGRGGGIRSAARRILTPDRCWRLHGVEPYRSPPADRGVPHCCRAKAAVCGLGDSLAVAEVGYYRYTEAPYGREPTRPPPRQKCALAAASVVLVLAHCTGAPPACAYRALAGTSVVQERVVHLARNGVCPPLVQRGMLRLRRSPRPALSGLVRPAPSAQSLM